MNETIIVFMSTFGFLGYFALLWIISVLEQKIKGMKYEEKDLRKITSKAVGSINGKIYNVETRLDAISGTTTVEEVPYCGDYILLTCNNCGREELEEDARFCDTCGKAIIRNGGDING